MPISHYPIPTQMNRPIDAHMLPPSSGKRFLDKGINNKIVNSQPCRVKESRDARGVADKRTSKSKRSYKNWRHIGERMQVRAREKRKGGREMDREPRVGRFNNLPLSAYSPHNEGGRRGTCARAALSIERHVRARRAWAPIDPSCHRAAIP